MSSSVAAVLALAAIMAMIVLVWSVRSIKSKERPKAFWRGNNLANFDTGAVITSVYLVSRCGLWYFQDYSFEARGGFISKTYAMRAAESFFQVEIVNEPRVRNGEVKDND